MAAHEFVLDAESERARQIVDDVIDGSDYTVMWRDEWTAAVGRGSAARNVLFGAFVPLVRVDLAIRSLDDARTVVRLDNRASGLLGGVMGARRSRQGWNEIRGALSAAFGSDGVLAEERDPGPSRIV